MKIKSSKLKPVLFLFSMTVVCLCIVWVVNQFKSTTESQVVNESAEEMYVVESTSDILNNSDTSTPEKIPEGTEKPSVLAAGSNSNQCSQAVTKIDSLSVCSRSGSDEVDYKKGSRSGERVSVTSTVILTKVTMPLELLSGSDVKDSNRKLTSRTPIYKPAGEQIDDRTANALLIPGSNIQEEEEFVVDRPFSTKYSLAFGQKPDVSSEEGEIVVDKKLVNKCEHCNNKSNVNPDKSNRISEFMLNSLYKTPGESTESKKEPGEIEQCPANEENFIEWPSSRDACSFHLFRSPVTIAKSILEGIWSECNGPVKLDEDGNPLPRSETCVYAEDIVVIMSSPFGADKDCTDGVCTNAYMNTRNKSALSPVASSSYEDRVYYLTDCSAMIEGHSDVSIKCAWDMSHLFKERKFSEYDDLPGIESTPNKKAYSDFLIEEGNRRSNEPAISIF